MSNNDNSKQTDFVSSVREKLSDVLEDVTDKIGIDKPLSTINETSKSNDPPPPPKPSPTSIISDNINTDHQATAQQNRNIL